MTDPRGLFVPERCVILERSEKHDAIAELTAALWRSEPELDYRFIFQSIWDREIQLTTRISADIAMPHAQIPGMTKTYVCAGVSPEGIEYDQKDSPPIRLVVLVVGPPDGHLLTLSALARYLSSDEILLRIVAATSPQELHQALSAPMLPEVAVDIDTSDLALRVRHSEGLDSFPAGNPFEAPVATPAGSSLDTQRVILESALRIARSLEDSVLVIHSREPDSILDWYKLQYSSNNQDIRDLPSEYSDWDGTPIGKYAAARFPALLLVDTRAGLVDDYDAQDYAEDSLIHIISLPATRNSGEPVGLSLLMGLSRGWLQKGQTAVSVYASNRLSGNAVEGNWAASAPSGSSENTGSTTTTASAVQGTPVPGTLLNSIELSDLEKDFGLFFSLNLKREGRGIATEVFMRVLQLCTELAAEGREGKPVGTIFVLGDSDAVSAACQQLVANPFRGYDESERNVLDPSLIETLKEYSRIDGATIIRDDGVIMSSGTYIRVGQEVPNIPLGLGARHAAGAGISAITRAVSFTISESTRRVSVFFGGSRIMVL